GMMRLWGIRIATGYIMAFILGMGSIGVWLAIAISNIIGGIIAILWIKYGNWAKAVIKNN
ncbi:MAG: MATE family efflux transporter, partial [Candidatus Bathyarchaeia archaeon]